MAATQTIGAWRLALACLFFESVTSYSMHGHNIRAVRPASASSTAATALRMAMPAMSPPELNNTWFAMGYSSDIANNKPFGTKLLNEPIVLYRDQDGEVTCVTDVCPHRSAPLSMGDIDNGVLRCFYHGWGFGKEGQCVSVPTGKAPVNTACASRAVAEHDSMLYVWRGNPLAADARKLPETADAALAVVDTTLDYACEWAEVAQWFAEEPHLHWLHGTALPPAATLLPQPLGALPGRVTGAARTTARSDSPTLIRHVGATGFSEEMHIVPLGPERTRVLLRQRFPRDAAHPVLQLVLQIPGALALLTILVQNWNFEVALADEAQQVRQGSGASTEAPPQAYFERWAEQTTNRFGMTSAFGMQQQDTEEGTYGLKRSYVMSTPLAEFPPMVPTGTSSEGIPLLPTMSATSAGMVERFKAAQQSLAAGILSVPAALVTYKTIGPAFAALIEGGGHSI